MGIEWPEVLDTRRARWLGLFAVCLVVAIISAAVSQVILLDYRVYRWGGTLAFDPALYDATYHPRDLRFTYPPFAAAVFWVLSWLPTWLGAGLWNGLSIASLAAVMSLTVGYRAGNEEPVQDSRWWLLPLLLVAAMATEPVMATLLFGQINLILMALIFADLTANSRRFRGLFLGIAAGIKLTPLIFVGYLLLTRQWRAAANALLGFAVTMAIGWLANPVASHQFWTKLIATTDRVGGVAYASNQSVLGVLTRLFGGPAPTVLWFCLASLFAIVCLLLAWRAYLCGGELVALAWVGVAMLLASPISWSHHWVWVIPGIIVLVKSDWRRRTWLNTTAVGAALVVLLAHSIWWPPSTGDQELRWTLGQQLVGNAYVEAALIAIIWAPVHAIKQRWYRALSKRSVTG